MTWIYIPLLRLCLWFTVISRHLQGSTGKSLNLARHLFPFEEDSFIIESTQQLDFSTGSSPSRAKRSVFSDDGILNTNVSMVTDKTNKGGWTVH